MRYPTGCAAPARPARRSALHTRAAAEEEEEEQLFSAKLGPAKFRSPAVEVGL